jgi:ferric-dicitrate binding protein FerR (iron transport regulator)
MKTQEQIPEYVVAFLHQVESEEEVSLSTEWLKDPVNQEIFDQLKKVEGLTVDLHLLNTFDPLTARKKIFGRVRANRILLATKWIQRIAAILFLPALLGGAWLYLEKVDLQKSFANYIVTQEVVSQPGTKTHLFLPDSTEVWLNSASTLRFPSVFTGENRKIELDGEAYFKVFHNKEKPFIAKTNYLEVQALGTSFNLSAYTSDYKISTTLEEGKVRIMNENHPNKAIVVNPDSQVNYYPENKEYKSVEVRVKDVIAWKDGVLIFNETPFFEVAAKLGRWFNAEIKITDPSIANYRFTGTFTSESLDQVLHLLTLSAPIDYSASQRKLLENKSFSKQEIKVWKK